MESRSSSGDHELLGVRFKRLPVGFRGSDCFKEKLWLWGFVGLEDA